MENKIPVSWFQRTGKNWGDALNPVLVKHISGKEVEWINWGDTIGTHRYYVIGSILQSVASENCEIWGTGLMRGSSSLKFKPKAIHAVRGPLTRESLIKQGYDCPDVYGDPALLYPMFYKPILEKEFTYGIIPHYVDQKSEWVNKYRGNKDVKIINILDPINKVVDDINKCEIILSSSLHGVIAGDAYGIPSYWIELSDKVGGGGFKFMDYFASVSRPLLKPIKPNIDDTIKKISSAFYGYSIDIDLKKLYESCPFKK